jgi:hypothetical protein
MKKIQSNPMKHKKSKPPVNLGSAIEAKASSLTQGMRIGAKSEGYPLNYYPGK